MPKKIANCFHCKSKKVSPENFRDELSVVEFKISGLCQACQDTVFVPPQEEDYYLDDEDEFPPF